MKIYSGQFFTAYFGDARAHLTRDFLMNNRVGDSLWVNKELAVVKEQLALSELYVLRQEHGIQGVTVTEHSSEKLRGTQLTGDFLITNVPQIGLMVYTADCLPIILYDLVTHAVGICHAGWRGSVARVACITLHEMMATFGTNPRHVQVFFGPSALVCCYSVSYDFKEQFEGLWYKDSLFEERDNKLFFDLVAFNRLQLESCGVVRGAFCSTYSECTIENSSFCSARRDSSKGSIARQATIVSLT
ncbi:peptidoglycan editing factor PgeF [Candidatus Dependentiae bacterium]|nr:peptidoglycan editing factor PgeF [Candidatus Dependentiae bacterium]